MVKTILNIAFILLATATFAQPKWAKNAPTSSDYYIGIANANKTDENYIDKANNLALSRLSSSIAVNIASETNSQVIEKAGIISSTFESNISSFTKAQLEDFEIFEKWENKKEYWVYIRLSKAKYKQNMMQKQVIAKKEASQYYKLGQTALKGGNTITALSYFAKAGNAIGCFRGMGLRNLNQDTDSYLDVDVFVELNKILTSMQLTCDPAFLKTGQFKTNFRKVNIEANIMDVGGNMMPVAKIPIKANVKNEALSFAHIQPTNESGTTVFTINKLNSDGKIQISFTPDIWQLAGVDSETVFYDAFAGLSLPTATFTVNVNPVNVYIQSNVKNMGTTEANPITSVKAKQTITELKWVVTDFDDMADFILQVNAETRQGAEMQGIYTAFASGSVSLIKNSTGDELFRKKLAEINGGGPSFEVAGTKALEKLSETLSAEIKNIVEQL